MRRSLLAFLLLLPSLATGQSIIRVIDAPANASGLAWDGSTLWCGAFGINGDTVYRIDPLTGSVLKKLAVTSDTSYTMGLTFIDSELWAITRDGSDWDFYTIDTATAIRTFQFSAPHDYMVGLAYDGSDLWFCSYVDAGPHGEIWQSTTGGLFIDTMDFTTAPQMWGAAWDGTYLWVCNDGDNGGSHTAYQLDVSGASPVIMDSVGNHLLDRPWGLAWDGTYLWSTTRVSGQFKLIQIDPTGAGTPRISLPASYDFGTVIIGAWDPWLCPVGNTGTDTLVVDSVRFSDPAYSASATFPFSVDTGASVDMTVFFNPAYFDTFDAVMEVFSNDPLTPVGTVSLTGVAIYPQAQLHLVDDTHNFGSVRVGLDAMWRPFVWNVGSTVLTIDSVSYDAPEYHTELASFPISLGLLESVYLDAWCSPTVAGSLPGVLSIHWNADSVSYANLNATGDASGYGPGTVLWTWNAPPATFNHVNGGVAITNIDFDGRPDVVVTTESYATVAIHGSSSGAGADLWTFWTNTDPLRTGSVWRDQAFKNAGDLNADGYDDVVMGTAGGSRSVFALDGTTGDSLWLYDTHAIGDGGWVYEVGPVGNTIGDPGPDVIVGAADDANNTGPKRLFVFDGPDGTPYWEYIPPHPGGEGTVYSCRAVPDVNGDGYDEIAIGYGDDTPYTVALVNGQTHAVIWDNTMNWAVWSVIPVPDVTGDGIHEVVAGDMQGTITMWNGVTGAQVWTISIASMVNNIEVVGDGNGDGYPDLAVSSTQSNCLLRSSVDGGYIWAMPTGGQTNVVARIPDLNGDGQDDVLAGGEGNAVYVFSTVGGWQMWTPTPTYDEVNVLCAVPSVDGDATDDILAGDDAGRAYLIATAGGTSVPDDPSAAIPVRIALHPAHPNPFNPTTTFAFDLPERSRAVLEVFNVLGRRVVTVVDDEFPAGNHTVVWDASGFSSGVYFARLTANGESASRKVVLLK